ncbi:MAG: ABC transporter permease [Gammaproteobacteria bacterium]|nr:MAG: ABC transporter permease [Gammaproteobacteria bacterium]
MTPVLYRASFGYLFRHPWQLAMAILGICIGVAVMVAVDLANESSRRAFLMSMDTINGEATHQIIAGPAGVDEKTYTMLRVEHGIRDIAPIVSGYIEIGGVTLLALGIDMFAEKEFRNYTSQPGTAKNIVATDSGKTETTIRRILTEPDALLMSHGTAEILGLMMDESFSVSANGIAYSATLAGFLGGDDEGRLDNLVIADIVVLQHWLNMYGRLTRIDVKIPLTDEAGVDRIRQLLPPGTKLLTAAGRTDTTASMSDAFTTNLAAMSLLALLVGVFLIYNSVAFAVLQRRGLIGVLRALGLTRAEIFRLVVTEAAVLGVVGASLGVLLGTWLGEQLVVLVSRTISDHYFVVNVTDISLDSATLIKGMLAGLGATIVAAAVPAVEAASFQPQLALSRSVLERRTGRVLPILATVGIVLMALSALLLILPGEGLVTGLSAMFVLILGFAFCIPIAVKFIARIMAPVAGRIGGVPARLAIAGTGTSLSRTGVAIVALAIAVSATIGVSVMVNSFRTAVGDWLSNTLQSDVYVGVARGTLDLGLIDDLTTLEGIAAYSTSRRSWLETAAGRTRLVALQMAPGSYAGINLRDGDSPSAWRKFDSENAVLISDAYAYKHGVQPGDVVELETRGGHHEFAVAAVYQNYDSNDGAVLMNRATYDRYFDDARIDSIGLYLQPQVDPDSIMEQLRAMSAGRQALIMNSNARIREISLGIFDRTFVITNVLYWLAVGVAIIGILGAMLALQLERARELAILRAVGMTPGQMGGLVTLQTAFIGLLSGLAAIPLGLVMAWVLVEVINRRAFGWQMDIAIVPADLVTALSLSVGAALVAGVYPAWRAASARPALAMREE